MTVCFFTGLLHFTLYTLFTCTSVTQLVQQEVFSQFLLNFLAKKILFTILKFN